MVVAWNARFTIGLSAGEERLLGTGPAWIDANDLL